MEVESVHNDSINDESVSGDKKNTSMSLKEIRENCRLIERSVSSKEPRYTGRVLRGLFALRKQLTSSLLRQTISNLYCPSQDAKDELLSILPSSKETKSAQEPTDKNESSERPPTSPVIPEIDCYLHLLVLLYLMDACSSTGEEAREKVIKCAQSLMRKVLVEKRNHRRSMDLLAAKIYFYYTRSLEGELLVPTSKDRASVVSHLRAFLLTQLKSCCLSQNFEGQAVLINCLLRSYLTDNLITQADKLISKMTFPESASNNEWARYLYYLGRIKAVQLEYSESHKHLVQSLRKAPQQTLGFRHAALKLSVTVQMLVGEIPDRQTFLAPANLKALAPYLQLTRAVRSGDVVFFERVLEKFESDFKHDSTYNLILRLRHNVIKTAIRTISLAYSKISLADIASKLKLDSPEDAEYIVAKAIRDGVIEATIEKNEKGESFMKSNDTSDIYNSREPQLAFHHRIQFCLNLHNSSVKAMRFPPKGVWASDDPNSKDGGKKGGSSGGSGGGINNNNDKHDESRRDDDMDDEDLDDEELDLEKALRDVQGDEDDDEDEDYDDSII